MPWTHAIYVSLVLCDTCMARVSSVVISLSLFVADIRGGVWRVGVKM